MIIVEPTCEKCKKECSGVEDLNKHVKSCYGKDLNLSVEFKCSECQTIWNSAEVLRFHRFKEHGISEFVCDICASTIKSENYFRKHKTRVHQGIKEASCEICHKEYKTTEMVKLHIEKVHKNYYRFKCDQCDYKCQGPRRLTLHKMCKHTKDPVFQCRQCDFVTHVHKRLRNHVRDEHSKIKKY